MAPVGSNEPPPTPPPQIDQLPAQTEITDNGMVLTPSLRFDGDSSSPPWERPEPQLWDLLRTSQIELVEERVFDGSSGVFWARIRNDNNDLRSALLKFDGAGRGFQYLAYADEFMLDAERHDLLNRELAGYEAAKACGCEDLVPPMVGRVANPVELVSDAVRERIARQLRISPNEVDDKLGVSAILQWFHISADNFIEQWAMLGTSLEERWKRTSDQLRFSIFRAYALDFLFGCPERLVCDYLYNSTTDRLVIPDLQLCFPHPVVTAEKYLASRAVGWGKRAYVNLDMPQEGSPASAWDLRSLFSPLPELFRDQAIKTFRALSQSLSEDVVVHLGRVLLEYGVPMECIAGLFARMAFLALNPETVLDQPIEFVKSILVPMRRGYGTTGPTNMAISQFVNESLALIIGEGTDFLTIMSESD